MDISETRRANLARLIKEQFNDNKSEFAAAIGKSPPYVSRWYSEKKGKRNISSTTARYIEETLRLPPGSLDAPVQRNHPTTSFAAMYGRIDVGLLTRVIRLVEQFERERNEGKPPAEWVTTPPEDKAEIIARGYDKQAGELYESDRDKIRRIFKSVAG